MHLSENPLYPMPLLKPSYWMDGAEPVPPIIPPPGQNDPGGIVEGLEDGAGGSEPQPAVTPPPKM